MFMWTSSNSGFQRNFPRSISFPIASRPAIIARNSVLVSNPTFRSIVAWATEPCRSCRQSLQSKEIDSVNCATSAAGPLAKRPLREMGEVFFMRFKRAECAARR